MAGLLSLMLINRVGGTPPRPSVCTTLLSGALLKSPPKKVIIISRVPYADVPIPIVTDQKLTADAPATCAAYCFGKWTCAHIWGSISGETSGNDPKPRGKSCGFCGRRSTCVVHETQGHNRRIHVVCNCSF